MAPPRPGALRPVRRSRSQASPDRLPGSPERPRAHPVGLFADLPRVAPRQANRHSPVQHPGGASCIRGVGAASHQRRPTLRYGASRDPWAVSAKLRPWPHDHLCCHVSTRGHPAALASIEQHAHCGGLSGFRASSQVKSGQKTSSNLVSSAGRWPGPHSGPGHRRFCSWDRRHSWLAGRPAPYRRSPATARRKWHQAGPRVCPLPDRPVGTARTDDCQHCCPGLDFATPGVRRGNHAGPLPSATVRSPTVGEVHGGADGTNRG